MTVQEQRAEKQRKEILRMMENKRRRELNKYFMQLAAMQAK